MLTVSTPCSYHTDVPPKRSTRARRKRPSRYHHGDLRRALVEEALRTIQSEGVSGLTLRGVGHTLGVSRTALYRHFSDKAALLSEVAREGFSTLRLETIDAWERGGRGWAGFEAMGAAYVRFAVGNPPHYRVMFGGFVVGSSNPAMVREGAGAFQALVDAIVWLQKEGLMRRDDPLQLARSIWALVHGVAMLLIDGLLGAQADPDAFARFAIARIRTGTEMRN
jgi:AcrR family transcriptional regulator